MTRSDIDTLKEAGYEVSEDVAKLNRGKPASEVINNPEKPRKLRKAVGIRESNKYHAVRTYSELCDRTFDSKAECQHGEGLYLIQKAGDISDLRYQVKFVLCETPKITVSIDFSYLEKGKRVYEDVKGVLTRDSRTKYAWLAEKHRVTVRLTK